MTTSPAETPESLAPLILVVCTGNVCRSPLLERLLQQRLDAVHGSGFVRVRSAGTGALVGQAMDERSATVLRELGGDPAGFVARKLTEAMVSEAALVLTATRDHRSQVVRLDPRALRHAFTVREFAALLEHVPDGLLPSWGDPDLALRQLSIVAKSKRANLRSVTPESFDIADPYRQADQVYAQMRTQAQDVLARVGHVIDGGPVAT